MLFFKRRHDQLSLKPSQHGPVQQCEGYLTGQLLISTPLLRDSCFHQSVIYLFAHSADGAMGVIINQPMETVPFSDLLEDEALLNACGDRDLTVYYGGPVDRARGFVIHSDDYDNSHVLFRSQGIALSANTDILSDMLQHLGPRRALLAVGYAGWQGGQLEKEIEENSWISVPATPELVFHCDDEMKWALSSQSLGIDMNFFSPCVGHA